MKEEARVQYLFLDMNSYFASVEQQENPSLLGRPVAVVPILTEKTCAIAASYEAKAFGIKTGTMIYEAKKLCPDLIIVPARHDVYVEYHHAIMEELERHLPIETIHSIDEAACRLIGDECRPERAIRLAQEIKAGISRNIGPAIKCSIGLSVNTYLAKLATELEKPDGLLVLHLNQLPERILHMRLSALPWIGRRIERRLQATGVRDVATLWSLSPGRLRRIWGSVMGQRFWYMLHGIQVPPIETKKHMVGHSHVLAPPLRLPERAHLVARRLITKAASRMRRMGYWSTETGVSVRFVGGNRWRQYAPTQSTQDSFTLLRALDRMWKEMQIIYGPQYIKQVSIVLSRLSNQPDLCPDLFSRLPTTEDRAHSRRISLSRALDGLNRRYGRDTVTFGIQPPVKANYIGAKIAFTRIPEREEFRE